MCRNDWVRSWSFFESKYFLIQQLWSLWVSINDSSWVCWVMSRQKNLLSTFCINPKGFSHLFVLLGKYTAWCLIFVLSCSCDYEAHAGRTGGMNAILEFVCVLGHVWTQRTVEFACVGSDIHPGRLQLLASCFMISCSWDPCLWGCLKQLIAVAVFSVFFMIINHFFCLTPGSVTVSDFERQSRAVYGLDNETPHLLQVCSSSVKVQWWHAFTKVSLCEVVTDFHTESLLSVWFGQVCLALWAWVLLDWFRCDLISLIERAEWICT